MNFGFPATRRIPAGMDETTRLEIRLRRERRAELDAYAHQIGLSTAAVVKLAIARLMADTRQAGELSRAA